MLLRAAVATAAGFLLATGSATAARADAFRHRDLTGDGVFITEDTSGATSRAVDPTRRRADIEHFTVLHERWVVSAATTVRSMSGPESDWIATIVTSKGDRLRVVYRVSDRMRVPCETFLEVRLNGRRTTCRGLHATRTPSGIIAKVPTRCLGTPWKVRVGVSATGIYQTYDPKTYSEDEALRSAAVDLDEPRLSPWIAR
ncbi:hypothetical protein GCM10027446_30000 [Angustibacter peucedani]